MSVAFIGLGFATASWASRIPQVQAALRVTPGMLGLILLSGAGPSALAIPLAGIAIARLGEARVTVASALLAAIGLGVAAVGYELGVAPVAAGLFGLGFGTAAGDVAINVHGAAVERSLGRAIMPRFHAGWSLGTVPAGLGDPHGRVPGARLRAPARGRAGRRGRVARRGPPLPAQERSAAGRPHRRPRQPARGVGRDAGP